MRLSLLVPASLTEESPDPRIRTYKVGLVGRAAAVFGAREVVVYPDAAGEVNDARLITQILGYQATAPYLRKRLYKRSPELQFVGVLPPLNLPTHAVTRQPREGELREAVATRGGADIGLDRPATLRGDAEEGERLLVEVEAVVGGEAYVRRAPEGAYGGYEVTRARSLRDALDRPGLKVGTSRLGEPARALRERLRGVGAHGPVAVAFGPPGRGLHDIAEAEGTTEAALFDVVVNTVPGQRTATVRTEEAIWVTLGLANQWAGGAQADP